MNINSQLLKSRWVALITVALLLLCITFSVNSKAVALYAASVTETSITIPVSLPTDLVAPTNVDISIPVTIDVDVTGQQILSYQFHLSYDPTILQPLGVNVAGTLSQGWSLAENHTSAGEFSVAGSSTTPMSGSGSLLQLLFHVIGAPSAESALTLTSFQFNEGVPTTSQQNGHLRIITLPVVAQLSIAVAGADIRLTWAANPANQLYEIHHSLIPIATPSELTRLSTLAAGSTEYIHTGGAGNPVSSHFYLVRTVSSTGQAVDSNQVGSISYALNNTGSKYSLIALPFPSTTITNAKTLASTIGNIGALLKWNPSTQTFRFFVPPGSGDNFALATGDAVFVLVNNGGPNVTTMVGNVAPVSFSLSRGGFNFVSLPMQSATIINAAGVATNIGGVTASLSWNQQTQLFRFFAPPNSGDNFVVKPGTPFIVSLSGNGTVIWP